MQTYLSLQFSLKGREANEKNKLFKLLAGLMLGAGLIYLSACNSPVTDIADAEKTRLDVSLESRRDGSMAEKEALIKRGKYLMVIGACHDCHTPKVMTANGPMLDSARLLSGHPAGEPLPPVVKTQDWVLFNQGLTAFAGPWGISYAANLTPDVTGTGRWTFEQFETAIRKGKSKGLERGRDLLPPMPWQMYQEMTDEDLKSIFAYLQSIEPVSNLVPSPISPQDIASAGN